MKRMTAVLLVAACSALGFQASVAAWGMDVHRMITRRAIEGLPAEIKPFFMAKIDFISEHAVDPDLWIQVDLSGKLGNEAPNHFLDYDGFKDPFPFKNVPREWDAEVRGGRATIRSDAPTATVEALAAWARGLGVDELPGLAVTRPSLEDVYLSLIDERAAAADAAVTP